MENTMQQLPVAVSAVGSHDFYFGMSKQETGFLLRNLL